MNSSTFDRLITRGENFDAVLAIAKVTTSIQILPVYFPLIAPAFMLNLLVEYWGFTPPTSVCSTPLFIALKISRTEIFSSQQPIKKLSSRNSYNSITAAINFQQGASPSQFAEEIQGRLRLTVTKQFC